MQGGDGRIGHMSFFVVRRLDTNKFVVIDGLNCTYVEMPDGQKCIQSDANDLIVKDSERPFEPLRK
jgi:predicted nucleic-acid-binding Zn-ribbon protein